MAGFERHRPLQHREGVGVAVHRAQRGTQVGQGEDRVGPEPVGVLELPQRLDGIPAAERHHPETGLDVEVGRGQPGGLRVGAAGAIEIPEIGADGPEQGPGRGVRRLGGDQREQFGRGLRQVARHAERAGQGQA